MSKAYGLMTVKSFTETEDQRIIKGVASTPKPDRDNDIVEPKGAKFAIPIPLLWQHNLNQPIGEVTEANVTEKGIEFVAKIAKVDEPGTLKDRLDEAWLSIKSGLVKCVSIGFRPLEYEYLKNSNGLHIKRFELYELSVVTVPANADAMITSVKQIKEAFAAVQAVETTVNEYHAENQVETDEKLIEIVKREVENALQNNAQILQTAESDPAAVNNPGIIALIDPAAGAINLKN